MYKTVHAFDFDGTLFNNAAPGAYPEAGTPRELEIACVKYLMKDSNVALILHTCREGVALDKAMRACHDNGITFHFWNENAPWRIEKFGDVRKISADYYWDSKFVNSTRFFLDTLSTTEEAIKIIDGARKQDYGPPEENFKTISAMWTAFMGFDISPEQVAQMMALLKIARMKTGYKRDSIVDAQGYLILADMLHALSLPEE